MKILLKISRKLFAIHGEFTFQENLERLVEATKGIAGRAPKFQTNEEAFRCIRNAPGRAKAFLGSREYADLLEDPNARVAAVQDAIVMAASIDNVNIWGRVIEYLITEEDVHRRDQIVQALREGAPLPALKTEDRLGDYAKTYPGFRTQTDIKSKALFLDGNPKAYNIDKLLEFLASEQSVYMIYLLGITSDGKVTSRLCSVFDKRLLAAMNVTSLWAGRNSRGVAQFYGNALAEILEDAPEGIIDLRQAEAFLDGLLAM